MMVKSTYQNYTCQIIKKLTQHQHSTTANELKIKNISLKYFTYKYNTMKIQRFDRSHHHDK